MKETQTYIFVRADGVYPLELKNDTDAIANAKCNPGTVRVEDALGRVVWPAETRH